MLGDNVRANLREFSEQLRNGGYQIVANSQPAGARRLRYVLSPSGVSTFDVVTDYGGWFQFAPIPQNLTEEFRSRLRNIMPSRRKQIDAAKHYVGVPMVLFADSTVAHGIADVALWMRSAILEAGTIDDTSSAETGI